MSVYCFYYQNGVFIITDKTKVGGEEVEGVGFMKDEEVHLGDWTEIETFHTPGGSGKSPGEREEERV